MMLWRLQQPNSMTALTMSRRSIFWSRPKPSALSRTSAWCSTIFPSISRRRASPRRRLRQAAGDESTFRLLRAKMAGVPQLDALAIATSEGDIMNRTRSYPVSRHTSVAGREYFARLRDHPSFRLLYQSAAARRRRRTDDLHRQAAQRAQWRFHRHRARRHSRQITFRTSTPTTSMRWLARASR